ncbi:response regulator transcription factor [Variovorax sp. KK3]|uniref:response regulator n=1 Tax=Variovorax sp. KK3 TaxID=1855728 RepID=UPI00097C9B85|nr:response regulator transcription factor [Variovorax sp. KK3]
MIRLLLVDDHPVVRAGYQHLLEQGGDMTVVAQGGNVDEGCVLYARHAPDITITDLSMPGPSGLELVRRLRERAPDALTLVFSMHDSDMLVQRALELGARGFVSKSSAPDCLIDAVHAVIGGRRYLSPDLPQRLLKGILDAPGFESLTQREFEIFQILSRGESLADCARSLHLSPKTVSNHQSLIKDKLGIGTTAAMAHLAIRHGLIQPVGC